MKSPDNERFMSSVKVGPKGQIVIPKEVREMFKISPGDNLILLADINKGIAIERKEVMNKISDAIFAGKGKEVVPGSENKDLINFANAIKKVGEE